MHLNAFLPYFSYIFHMKRISFREHLCTYVLLFVNVSRENVLKVTEEFGISQVIDVYPK